MSNKTERNSAQEKSKKAQQGFSLIEAIIAIFILTIGLIGTAAAVTYALEFSTISRNVTKAKLVVVASIEEVESLRNSRRLNFKQFANVGSVDNSDAQNNFMGFSDGYSMVSSSPGPDGVNGTADDISTAPGNDGVFGTPDDTVDMKLLRSGYIRQIQIVNLSANLKKVIVRVRYTSVNGKVGEIVGVSYLNNDARTTI